VSLTSVGGVAPQRTFANIAAATTDGAIVAAVAGRRIRVIAAVFMGSGTATTLTFTTKPAGAGSAISCLFANAINGGAQLAFNPAGWFETNIGEGLSATTGAGTAIGIQLVYAVV
jgi:hypothetical protein